MSDKGRAQDATGSLWSFTALPPPATQRLEASLRTDVAIIGGGYTGLSTALHLAELGIKPAVLEAFSVGHGASGRNGGHINAGTKYDPVELKGKFPADVAQKMIDFSSAAPDVTFDLISRFQIGCDALRTGWILPAHNHAALDALKRRADAWQSHAADVRVLSADEVAERIGTDRYVGGIIDLRCGNIQPLSFVRGLARAAINSGALVFSDTPATALTRAEGGWRVKTPKGEVLADHVVIATNGYTDGLWPRLQQSVLPVNSFQIATAPLAVGDNQKILPQLNTVSDSRRIMLYYRKDREGRLVIGGRGRFREPRGLHDYGHLMRSLRWLFPQLSSQPIDHFWSGRVAITYDHLPHIHQPERGITIALGYNGRGVAMATAMGKRIAEHIHGASDSLPFVPSQITPIPFHRFNRLATSAAIGWYTFRDGIDALKR
jgi:glycine/D-amino acid oxidase-like deaminating enzyme